MEFNEIWAPVVGYENKYEVSNLGKVRNSQTFKQLRDEPLADIFGAMIKQLI